MKSKYKEMKKNLIAIFSLFFLLIASSLQAADMLPDTTGEAFVEREPEERFSPSLGTHVMGMLDLYQHFDEMFPGDAIDGDLSAEVKRLFPNDSQQKIYDREDNIRFAIKNMRGIYGLYLEIKAQMLVPEAPPLLLEDDEYDRPYDKPYINSDKLVVIVDLKKVVNYGSDRRNFEAIEAKFERDRKKSLFGEKFDKLKKQLSQLELKKLPFYGIIYEDPFTGRSGIGEWNGESNKARLLSEVAGTAKQKEIRAGLEFRLDPQTTLSWKKGDLNLDLSESENLQSYQLFRQAPEYFYDDKEAAGYRRSVVFPLTATLRESGKPLILKAKVTAKLCDDKQSCSDTTFFPELTLGNGEAEDSAISNYLAQNYNLLPRQQSSKLKILRVVADQPLEENRAENLRVVLEADGDPSAFAIFADSQDGIEFDQPHIGIRDGQITARFIPLDPNTKLTGKTLEITAKLNNSNIIRGEYEVKKASFLDTDPLKLNLGIVLLALTGGLILNFMPCVFPVLSLKLLSLTKFGGKSRNKTRRGFGFTIIGIYLAFGLLIGLLLILKTLGVALGWGMQFQNPQFLGIMCFVMILFLAQISGWINLNTPQWADKILQRRSAQDDALNFLTGLFLVLLATPCSAPYLGTAVGFALSGSSSDIIIVISAVGIGLSLPYLLLFIRPDLADFMPHPGAWVKYLNRLMGLFLLLTVIWLLSIIAAQSGKDPVIMLTISLAGFMFVLWFRKILVDTTDKQNAPLDIKLRVIKLFNYAAAIISVVLLAISMIKISHGFAEQQQRTTMQKSTEIRPQDIQKYLAEDKIVLLSVGADWCLTCKFNEFTVLDNFVIEDFIRRGKLVVIEVDWTNYNRKVLDFMERYGRKGLPFYVLYSPKIPNGIVLPEVLTEKDLAAMIKKMSF